VLVVLVPNIFVARSSRHFADTDAEESAGILRAVRQMYII
jgi:hypothetical protein